MWMQQISAREKLTAYEGNAAAYRARVNPPGDHDHEEVGRHGWCVLLGCTQQPHRPGWRPDQSFFGDW